MISTITGGVRERRCVLSKRPKSGHFVGVSWFVRFFSVSLAGCGRFVFLDVFVWYV